MTERKDKFLSAQQKRACEEYVIDCNQTAAYIRAGYSPRGAAQKASALFKQQEMKDYIKVLQTAIKDRLTVTQDRVINDILEVKERCMQVKAIMKYNKEAGEYEQAQEWAVNEAGEEVLVGMFQFDAQGALKACDMLAKHVGLYEVDNKQKAAKLQIDIDRDKVRAIVQENDEFVG